MINISLKHKPKGFRMLINSWGLTASKIPGGGPNESSGGEHFAKF